KPWWRIPESEKEPGRENDSQGDDNPDIHQYLGYGELHFGYRLGEHNLGMMIRNNLDGDNRGAVQLDWSFPINQRFRGYIQYFNGYGESLIDYNDSANRLSLGIMLTDWL
ncbi:MAG: phospholipase A, partial [Endozoicomonas sp.]